MENIAEYLSLGFKLIRCKGEHLQFNANKDYKIAKQALDHGFTGAHFKGLSESEAKEWLDQGGWIGGLVPQDMIFIDSEIPHSCCVIEQLCRAKGLTPPIMLTRRGKQYPFLTRDALTGSQKEFTRHGIEVTYRAGGKNYVVLPPAPGRHWVNGQNFKTLPDLPEELLPYRRDNIDENLNCLSHSLAVLVQGKGIGGYDDVDLSFTSFLLELGLQSPRIHHCFQIIFGSDYDPKRTDLMIQRTRQKISTGENLRGTGSLIERLKDLRAEDALRFIKQIKRPSIDQKISEKQSQQSVPVNLIEALEPWESIRAMDIQVEWVVDRLIPKDSITLLFGKGGIGKTWLTLDMARAIASGTPYVGLSTTKAPVIFIDFENPLAVLNIRTQKLGDGAGVYFWRANNPKLKAPKLDKADWELYKQLPAGAVLIFDTLRASQDKDENRSDEMGLILGRLKELRDSGFTIILLHHTAKNSDRAAKGSTAIVDLADHILGLTLVRKKHDGQEIVVDDEDSDEDTIYRFGVREKTRFDPYHVYLTLNPDRGFDLAPDPQEDSLREMQRLLIESGPVRKTIFLDSTRQRLSLSSSRTRRLFEVGQGRYWRVEKLDTKNTQIVHPVQFSSFSPLYSAEELKNSRPVIQAIDQAKEPERVTTTELFSFSNGLLKTEKQTIVQVDEILA